MTPERAQEFLNENGDLIGSPLEKQLREAHRRVMKHHGHPPDGVLEADMVRAFLSIQAAEITRLQAKVDAAEKLAEAATPYVSIVQNGDYGRQLRQHDALVAALAAFQGASK